MGVTEAMLAIRKHWAIENGLHWSLDVGFREDRQVAQKINLAENLAVLRRIALDPNAKNPPRGTKSWRHQNPGNVTHGDFSKQHGEIGFACYPNPYNPKKKLCFAIFPDYETG